MNFTRRPYRFMLLVIILVCVLGISAFTRDSLRLIFLPGTPVGSVDPSEGVDICRQCHFSNSMIQPVTIQKDWAGSMMAHAARDPIFYAALAGTNTFNETFGQAFGEYCIRCHSPMGWLAGHSEDATGQQLTGTDFDGIQCDYCHRAVDALRPDSTVPPMVFPVPGYGNGMHVLQTTQSPKRGPYTDAFSSHHDNRYDSFLRSSELCAVCHDVSNPFHTEGQDRITKAPHQYAPIERTYSEWLMSSFSSEGAAGTCLGCHMKKTSGYACIFPTAPFRTHMGEHDLTGGNTFVPDILPDFWDDLDTSALARGQERARTTLRRAADVSVAASRNGDTVVADVRITNVTGHKLPTGYPEGRRMWIHLVGVDAAGDTVFESGRYDRDSARLVRDEHIMIFESIHGLTEKAASMIGSTAGPSFHFILNDTILFDNRIPPRGFTLEKFRTRMAEPVGASYADSQYWADTRYRLPHSAVSVTASLLYQTISREYLEYLRDINAGNPQDWNKWGEKLHDAWKRRGQSAPEIMNTTTAAVAETTTSVSDVPPVPGRFLLHQNIPNPFNPVTRIRYEVRIAGHILIRIFTLHGQEVARLADDIKEPGIYEVTFDAENRPSGVYLCIMENERLREVKKMLLLR